MATDYISLRGEMFLAKLVGGQPSALRSVGNTPELSIKISSDKIEHKESKTGADAVDFIVNKNTQVEISGQLEEVNKENLALIISGETLDLQASKVTDKALGAVKANQVINLGVRNLTNVVFKDDQGTAIPTADYTIDAVYGTAQFNKDFTAVTCSADVGARTRTLIANNVGKDEYAMLFKGIDTASGQKFVVDLWRLRFSPDTEFDLIHDDLGSYSFDAQALSDSTKASDPELGLYGTIERFSV